MTIMRLGHTGLNNTMFLLKKHPSGLCDCGMEDESVEHVICHCIKYKMLDFLHLAFWGSSGLRFGPCSVLIIYASFWVHSYQAWGVISFLC